MQSYTLTKDWQQVFDGSVDTIIIQAQSDCLICIGNTPSEVNGFRLSSLGEGLRWEQGSLHGSKVWLKKFQGAHKNTEVLVAAISSTGINALLLTDLSEAPLASTGISTIIGIAPEGNFVNARMTYKNVKNYGAIGDGAANDTAKLQSLLSAGGNFEISGGTFLVDGLVIPARSNIIIDPTATVKFRAITADTDTAVFKFTAGAAGSFIGGGGTIDGNRSAILSAYLALAKTYNYGGTRYTIESEFDGIRSEPCDNITIQNLIFRNIMTQAVCHRGGDNPLIRNILAHDCTKMINAQFHSGGVIEDLFIENCGNYLGSVPIPYYSNVYDFRDNIGTKFDNLRIETFRGKNKDSVGALIADPFPTAFSWERITNCEIRGIDAGNYIYDSTDPTDQQAAIAAVISSPVNCNFNNLIANGYYYGHDFQAPVNTTIDGFTYSNTYGNTGVIGIAASAGVRHHASGIYPIAGGVDADYRSNSGGKSSRVRNGKIFGFTLGAYQTSDDIIIEDTIIQGAETHGAQLAVAEPNTFSFPGAVANPIRGAVFKGLNCQFNGHAGIDIRDGDDILISDCIMNNNGQRITTDTLAVGLRLDYGNARSGITVQGGSWSDTQNFTKVKALSFIPGVTDSKNRILVLVKNTSALGIGQYIKLVNATSTGDITARIINIDKDIVTFECATAQTFSATGNLTALSGTWTVAAGSTLVNGVGGAADTQFTGPVYVKIGTEYKQVARVNSANQFQLVSPVTGSYAAVVVNKVECDIVGIPSQQRPNWISGNCTEVSWQDVKMAGNIVNAEKIDAASVLANGQEFYSEMTVTLNTSGIDTIAGIIFSAAERVTPLEGSVIVTQAITGTITSFSLTVGTNSTNTAIVSGIALAKNSKGAGLVPTSLLAPADGFYYPSVRTTAGSVTAGAVKVRYKYRKSSIPLFANVP
jgi:hypothetical protein